MELYPVWCNLKPKSIGICIERRKKKESHEGGVTMPEAKPTSPPPFLLYGLHSFYTNANAFWFEVAPKIHKGNIHYFIYCYLLFYYFSNYY
jgi:hypothetical protein